MNIKPNNKFPKIFIQSIISRSYLSLVVIKIHQVNLLQNLLKNLLQNLLQNLRQNLLRNHPLNHLINLVKNDNINHSVIYILL